MKTTEDRNQSIQARDDRFVLFLRTTAAGRAVVLAYNVPVSSNEIYSLSCCCCVKISQHGGKTDTVKNYSNESRDVFSNNVHVFCYCTRTVQYSYSYL